MPKISVVTSVYNCEDYISDTIQSVIDQTFTDWEYILVDDCSTDQSVEIIRSFHDPRIILINNERNKGQCANLNYGISIAKGKYIARLDHDDLCYPQRLDKQFKYMEKNPEVVLLGTLSDYWDNGVLKKIKYPDVLNRNELMFSLAFVNRFMAHSSFFIRKSVMEDNDIWYDTEYRYAEDYQLLLSLLAVGKIDCLMEELITYRIFPEQTTAKTMAQIIRDEKERPRIDYFDNIEYNDKQVIKKAIVGDIESFSELRSLEREMISYAIWSGLDVRNNTHNKVFFYMIYNNLLTDQKRKILACYQKIINRFRMFLKG